MKEQFGGIYWQLEQFITKPTNNTFVRLFRDKADNAYKIKKADGSIELFVSGSSLAPNTINHTLIWVNGAATSEGDGSILNPFKTIQTAVASLVNDNTKSYSIRVYPSEYTGADVTLPSKSSVTFLGLGIAAQTSFSFAINDTPDVSRNQVQTHQAIAFVGGYNFDGSALGGGILGFDSGAVALNRIDNNNSVFTLVRGAAVFGTRLGGLTLGYGLVLIADLNVPTGAILKIVGTIIVDPTKQVIINGTAALESLGTLNVMPTVPFVTGIPIGPDTPTWLTDFASNTNYNGTLNKSVVGGGATGTFQDNLGNTVHVTDGLITSFT